MLKLTHSLLLLLCCFSVCLTAQTITVTGKVIDNVSKEPLPFVNIVANNTRLGTSTDIDGRFEITLNDQPENTLKFTYIGYKEQIVTIYPNKINGLIIEMEEKTSELQEVTVFPGENPAHRIIRNTVKNRDINNPENLESFSYKTYSKFVATINVDSVDPSIDTVFHSTIKDSIVRIDSGNYELVQFMNRQHLFFSETVTNRQFIKGKRDNEEVLATKTSGFKNPLFALLSTELQSFSFYNDYISIAGSDFLNPITPGSTKRYFFIIEDTTYNSLTDTVYIISYRPRPNYGFKPIQGVLYINSSHWAIQNVIAKPVETEGVQIEVEQKYKLEGTGTWFPEQLNANLIFGTVSVNAAVPEARMRTYIKDVEIGSDLNKAQISRAKVSILEDAVDDAPEILAQNRNDSLDPREMYTYEFMDSINEAENLDRGLNRIVSLVTGNIPLGPINIKWDKFLKYNQYEGIRPGLGIRTNNDFAKWVNIGAYAGYGFKDSEWKYKLDAEFIINKPYNFKIFGGHQFDLFETGAVDFIQIAQLNFLENSDRQFFLSQFDRTTRHFAGITFDPFGNLKLEVMGRYEDRDVTGTYTYDDIQPEDPNAGSFKYFEIITGFKWTPSQDYIEGGGIGKLALSQSYPIIHLQHTAGLQGMWESEYQYNKVDVSIDHQIKTLRMGTTGLNLKAGTVLDNVPISKNYVGSANLYNEEKFFDRMTLLADRQSFETMRFTEFYSDTYIQLMYRQDFKTLFFRRDKFAPHIEVVGRALFGTMKNRDLHQNIDFKVPDKGYYEAGLEFNRLLNQLFSAFGVGFYYRIGPYSFPRFDQNFAFKITSKFVF